MAAFSPVSAFPQKAAAAYYDTQKLDQFLLMHTAKPAGMGDAGYTLFGHGRYYDKSKKASSAIENLRIAAEKQILAQPANADSINKCMKERAIEEAINMADMAPGIGGEIVGSDIGRARRELGEYRRTVEQGFAAGLLSENPGQAHTRMVRDYYKTYVDYFDSQIREIDDAVLPSSKRKLAAWSIYKAIKERREEMEVEIRKMHFALAVYNQGKAKAPGRVKFSKERGKKILDKWRRNARLASFQTSATVQGGAHRD